MDTESFISKNKEIWRAKCLYHITDKLVCILYNDAVNSTSFNEQCRKTIRILHLHLADDEEEETAEVKQEGFNILYK